MNKIPFALALCSLSVAVMADGWKFAPVVNDPTFKMQPTVAATVASVKPQGGSSATAYGVEMNFNCGLLQSPDNRIRTHLAISHVDENGYQATSLELSPRYTVPVATGLSVGVGPSLGVVRLDPAGAGKETLFAYGVVAGLNYRMGALYTGVDLGLRRTAESNGIDYDSRYAALKVGVNF